MVGSSHREEGEEEGSSFPPLQQQRSRRHTKFDDDDDEDDEEEEHRRRKADDEVPQQTKKKKKRPRSDDDGDYDGDYDGDDDDGKEARRPPPLPPPPAPAPCRVDLSLTAAAISVALRYPQQSEKGAATEAEKEEKKKKTAVNVSRPAPRGNYSRYYGYRLGLHASSCARAAAETADFSRQTISPQLSPAHEALYGPGAADPRLRSLLPYLGLFRGRRLLDVGCNGGVLTLALASAAGVSSALGVDADGTLVRSARARCRRMRESVAAWEKGLRAGREALKRRSADVSSPPSSSPSPASPSPSSPASPLLPEPGGRSLAGKRAAARACSRALRATEFRHEDFVRPSPPAPREGGGEEELGGEQGPEGWDQLFGAALCLSVTKWIHLAYGDQGIERLFARLSRCLSKGAHLVLEPQPWRSYQRAMKKKGVKETLLLCSSSSSSGGGGGGDGDNASPRPHRSLASLKMRPDDFVSLLEEPRYGFALVRSLGAPEGAAPGFDRPLLLFRKR